MRLATLLSVLAMIGCNGRPIQIDSDAGVDNDGSVPINPQGETCASLEAEVVSWLAHHQSCTVADDCTVVATECGLPGLCGSYVNRAAPGAYLSSLLDAWQRSCATPCGVDCALVPPPVCVSGQCARAVAGRLPIGDPCTADDQCASGQCETEAASNGFFVGGYCTIRNCDTIDAMCPAGSSCRAAGDGRMYCLKDCCRFCRSKNACRTGYGCCASVQMPMDPASCVPLTSPICNMEG